MSLTTVWAFYALFLWGLGDEGQPCGGEAVSLLALIAAATGFVAAVLAVVGAASADERKVVIAGFIGVPAAFALWLGLATFAC